MPCCSAVNCSNRSEKGYKLFRFPKDDRGAKWVQNMRRGDKWSPTGSARLCEVNCTLFFFFILMLYDT